MCRRLIVALFAFATFGCNVALFVFVTFGCCVVLFIFATFGCSSCGGLCLEFSKLEERNDNEKNKKMK